MRSNLESFTIKLSAISILSFTGCFMTADDSDDTNQRSALVCVGFAPACEELDPNSCGAVNGCEVGLRCTGSPMDCSWFEAGSCSAQDGCSFHVSSNSCTGDPDACESLYSEYQCSTQVGCEWTSGCAGQPEPCELLDAASCESQPGCSLQLRPDWQQAGESYVRICEQFIAKLNGAKCSEPSGLDCHDAEAWYQGVDECRSAFDHWAECLGAQPQSYFYCDGDNVIWDELCQTTEIEYLECLEYEEFG